MRDRLQRLDRVVGPRRARRARAPRGRGGAQRTDGARRPRRLGGHRSRGATLLALLGALAIWAGGCGGGAARTPSSAGASASGFEGGLLPAGLKPPHFTLTDQYGRRVSPSDFRGRVTILAFLYSTSRHTSPLIAQQIRGALDELALERDPPAVAAVAISVDPAADTRAHVRAFLRASSLTGRLEYLTGDPAQLRAVWRAYRVVPANGGEQAYERGASVLLLDRSGDERVELSLEELTPEALAHDVGRLAAH
jgi:protein SCO1/2